MRPELAVALPEDRRTSVELEVRVGFGATTEVAADTSAAAAALGFGSAYDAEADDNGVDR